MASLARWCFRRRRIVLLLWIAALVGTVGAGLTVGSAYRSEFTLPGTGSQKTLDLLQRDFPAVSGDSVNIVLHTDTGTVRDPGARSTATAMLAKVGRLPHVTEIGGPFDAAHATQVSDDGKTAFATVALDKQANDLPLPAIQKIIDTARASNSPALRVELAGFAIQQTEQSFGSSSELIGIVAAAIVLFVAFGSLLAVTLPLLTAIMALGVGLQIIGLLSHPISIADFGPTLATLIGLGVGIDYALFIVNRHRVGLRAGKSPEEAAITALNTSGRAVLFAGVTVCIALLGMFALGVDFLYGVALSAALVVALTMVAAVTLLPALLGFYGMKVLSRSERARLAADGPEIEVASGFWWRWSKGIAKRPAIVAVGSAALILLIAVPFFSLRLGSSDAGNGSEANTTRRAYDLLATGFGAGFNGPFTLAAEINSKDDTASFNKVLAELRTEPGVSSVTTARPSPNGTAAIASLYPTTSPQDAQTAALLDRLRNRVIPGDLAGTSTVVYVGGVTATFADFAHVLSGKLPLFIGIVVGLAFLLLVIVFRSLVIPLTASVMNLFAVGASFGAMITIFQWGWFGSLFGVKGGPIEPFLPVMLFAILFGLSMDYEVFLVSRMHEEWGARRDNRLAVSLGQAETGRVITAAGTIMTFVFASFILGDNRVIKMFGLGLAAAVMIDAFVIRTLLVPALMHLFGRANWWLPRWLDRVLPRLSVESSAAVDETGHRPLPDNVGTPILAAEGSNATATGADGMPTQHTARSEHTGSAPRR